VAGAALITPNLAEAAELSGLPLPRDEAAMREVGTALLGRGAGAVLVKGGHLEGEAVDLLVQPGGITALRGPRVPGTRRGTGCRLASFLAGRLAAGDDLPAAAAAAKRFIAHYLQA
jgi:hydroxymethylpyrimidine/phosphomethylpyrimidine kinase